MIEHYVSRWLIVVGCMALAGLLLDWIGAFPEEDE